MFLPFVVSAGLAAFFKNFEALYKMVNVTGAVTQQPRQTIKYTGLYFSPRYDDHLVIYNGKPLS